MSCLLYVEKKTAMCGKPALDIGCHNISSTGIGVQFHYKNIFPDIGIHIIRYKRRETVISLMESPTLVKGYLDIEKTHWSVNELQCLSTLRPRQNGRHIADDIFKCIFVNENVCIPIKISLKFVPKGPINNIPALVQIIACRRPGDKPLSELMMVSLLTHICVTRPQWVK